jgi:hypothetical protein
MVGEMPYLGARATAADITACLEARGGKRARSEEVLINRVSVQLVDLYNAVAEQGGPTKVSGICWKPTAALSYLVCAACTCMRGRLAQRVRVAAWSFVQRTVLRQQWQQGSSSRRAANASEQRQ